ncbi:MAG TPA: CPBP family intramembrane glutamic endopeptidase [Bacillota bacterium]
MNQSEIIKQMSDQEVKKSLVFSQLLFISIAFVLSVFLFDNLTDWQLYFNWQWREIVYYGIFSGLLVVSIDLMIMKTIPKRFYDDGGINERIFTSLSIPEIIGVTLLIAISEEFLFRGVIQTVFGYVFASTLFALVHIRYLKKPLLLISVLFVSFLIGYIFEVTGNLLVTITSHFTIDVLLGLIIYFKK